jgi:hypothetical protein
MNSETTARLDRGKVYVVYCDGIGWNVSTKGAYKLARLACPPKMADRRPCHSWKSVNGSFRRIFLPGESFANLISSRSFADEPLEPSGSVSRSATDCSRLTAQMDFRHELLTAAWLRLPPQATLGLAH